MKRCMAILLSVLLTIGCFGCISSGLIRYANADKYTAGDFTYDASEITAVDIDWAAGDITLKNGTGTLSVSESGGDTLDKADQLHWWIDGSTLKIKYCESGRISTVSASQKDLTVELPNFADLKIDIASGKIAAENMLNLGVLDVNTASGGVGIEYLSAKEVKIDSASGGVNLAHASVSGTIRIDSASGGVSSEILSADSVRIDVASGGVKLRVGMVNSIDIDSASGGVNLQLVSPERGAKVRCESVSGKVNIKLPYEKSGSTYKIGLGDIDVKIDAVSGTITVE